MQYRIAGALVLAVAGLLASAPAAAGSIILSTGQVDPSDDGFDRATTANIAYGLEIVDAGFAEIDLELGAGRTIESGGAPGGREYDFTTVGAGLSARTAGPVYVIGRYGIARNEIDIDGGDSSDATQQSVGIGVGGSLGIVQLELMARRYAEQGDLDDITWISAHVRF